MNGALALAACGAPAHGDGGPARIADRRPRGAFRVRARAPAASPASWSPDGSLILVYEGDAPIATRMASNGLPFRSFPGTRPGRGAIFSPTGANVAIVGAGIMATVLDTRTWTVRGDLGRKALGYDGRDDALQAVVFDPTGTKLACGSRLALTVWNVQTGALLHTLESLDIRSLAWPSPTRLYAAINGGGAVQRFDLDSNTARTVTVQTPPSAGTLQALHASMNGRVLPMSGGDGRIRLFDTTAESAGATFPVSDDQTFTFIDVVTLSADGRRLLTLAHAAARTWLRVWDVASATLLAENASPVSPYGAALSPDGGAVAMLNGSTLEIADVVA